MQLLITGVHQRSTPIALREHLAFSADLPAALVALRAHVAEAFIISTCNRVEICALVEDPADDRTLRQFLADWKGLSIDTLLPHTYTYSGDDAVRHLFRLAAGLDSMVLGEDQILSQLKEATALAEEIGTLGTMLHRLTQHALATGKLVRTQTGISKLRLSVVSIGFALAKQSLGTLEGKRVLLVGAGKMAVLACKHLHDIPGIQISVINRTQANAQALAGRYGARVWACDELIPALRQADVVLSCTASPGAVIEIEHVARAMEGRSDELLLLDVAVPRDIDRRVASLAGVRLFDVDDMQAISARNRVSRAAEMANAEALVEQEVGRFGAWWASQEVTPTIRALRQRAEAIRAAELERTLARLPDLSEREQAAIQALSAAIVNKLLHQPIASLKDPHTGGQLARSVQQLFQLSDEKREHHVNS